MADAEGNGRTRVVGLEEFVEADGAETRLTILEEMAETDAEATNVPWLFVPEHPVGADSVMRAIDEAFVKAIT